MGGLLGSVDIVKPRGSSGGGGGGSIPIFPPTGNNGDIISTNAAGTQFNRVTTEELATEVLAVETINFVQPDTLIPVTKQIPLLNTDGKLDAKFFYTSSTSSNPNNVPSESNPVVTQNQSIINNLIFG